MNVKRGRPADSNDSLGPNPGQKVRGEPDSEDSVPVNTRWTPEQDEQLRRAIDEFGSKNWKAIAERVPGRNHAQCLQRWNKVLKPGLVKGHWAFDEDDLLLKLVQESSSVNWADISKRIEGRTYEQHAKQCRERWKNHLDPTINKGPYKSEEDMILMAAYEELGNRWTQIAERLQGRTEDSVKMRWKVLNPNVKSKAKPGRPPLMSQPKSSTASVQETASSVGDAAASSLGDLDDDILTPAAQPDPESAQLMSRRASSMLDSFRSRDDSLLSFSSIKAEDWEIFRELVMSDHFAQAIPTAPREMVSVFDSFTDKSMTDDEFRRLVGVIENPDAIMDFIHETYASIGETPNEWSTCQGGCGGTHHDDSFDDVNQLMSSFHMAPSMVLPEPTPFETYSGNPDVQQATSLDAHVQGFDEDEDDDAMMMTRFHVAKRR
ncbi:hypothetical protein AeMF1_011481 [Aphanomyces euteiches]|nr:hypothetical protein AeMF1_011481 [Aphanomyces euteiches]